MEKMILKQEALAAVRNDEKFLRIVQLMRILGTIRYNQIIYVQIEEAGLKTNLKFFILMNLAAALYEGISKFSQVHAPFVRLDYYKSNNDTIRKILKEKGDFNSFTNRVLSKIRSKIAFHFDDSVIKEVINEFLDSFKAGDPDIVVISGESKQVKDTTYELADNMDFNYVLKLIDEKLTTKEEKFKYLAQNLIEISRSFCGILEGIIAEIVPEYCELIEAD